MACLHKTSSCSWERDTSMWIFFPLKTSFFKHLVLHLGPRYPSTVSVRWDKDFPINCLSGHLWWTPSNEGTSAFKIHLHSGFPSGWRHWRMLLNLSHSQLLTNFCKLQRNTNQPPTKWNLKSYMKQDYIEFLNTKINFTTWENKTTSSTSKPVNNEEW